MDDRKGKRKEHEISGSARESNRSTESRAYGGGGSAAASGALPIQDNPDQNAPRSASVADEPRGRPTGRQPGVELGGSAPRHGLQLQGQAQSSGKRSPPPKVCPDCHHSVFSNNIICVHCATEAARKLMAGPRSPPVPLQRQQRPHGLQGRWSPANLELVSDRPAGLQRDGAPAGGPPALENSRPGLLGPPQENPVPRAGERPLYKRRRGTLDKQPKPSPKTKKYVCPSCHVNICSKNDVVCQPCATARAAVPAPQSHDQRTPRPQQHQQPPPPPVDASWQQQLRYMAELAADICPVGERGGAPGGRSTAKLGHPDLQQPPQEHPVRPSDKPVDASWQQLRHMAELAADICPVGERGGAPGGRSAAQLGHPDLRRPQQEHPVPPADKLVGLHYNPVVLGAGPDPEDGWCPACRFYPARMVLQPRRHDCVCYTCLNVDHIVYSVCASA